MPWAKSRKRRSSKSLPESEAYRIYRRSMENNCYYNLGLGSSLVRIPLLGYGS